MCMEGYGKPVIQQRLSVRDREENPLLAESKFLKKLHFAPQNREEKSSALRKQISKEIAFCFAKERGFRQRIKGGALYGMVFRYFLLWA